MLIPECPYRPTRHFVTEFVTPNNAAIREQAAALRGLSLTDDDFIKLCANYIRDEFTYPLDNKKAPSAGLVFKRYDKGCCKGYYFNYAADYAWGFPAETQKLTLGICIDTALLYTSLLIAGGISAKTALGAIVSAKDGSTVGYHAWTTMMYQGQKCVNETTIHFDTETINWVFSLYNQSSGWVNSNGIFYRQEAEFDDKGYESMGLLGAEMVSLMGLPPQAIECYGLEQALDLMETKHKKMERERRKIEMAKHHILELAYGR